MRRIILTLLTLVAVVLPALAFTTATAAANQRYECSVSDGDQSKPDQRCDALSSDPDENPCIANIGDCRTTGYINDFIDFFAAAVGVVVVISIIIGGIQYSSSSGDPQKASAAKNRIRNSVIALILFTFFYALMDFLILGGIN